MRDPILKLSDIVVTFDGRRVVDKVSLTLDQGQIITLIGPNGAGKSTLLRVALGLLRPDSGHVQRAPGLRVGYMPQRLAVDRSLPLTVGRFLALGGAGTEQIAAALGEVAVVHLAGQPLQAISGGELQRVLLARALIRQPNLLVLDEPAQGVDLGGQTALYELIAELTQRHHCAVLMVSHDLHWVMARTDQVLCLNHHVCCQGHPEQVGADPAYQALFGTRHTPAIAPYHHHHNHSHDIHGDIVCRDQLPHA
jgi:zinc transport system ATP-binding protein